MEVDALRIRIQVMYPSLLRWAEEYQPTVSNLRTGEIWRECPCDWLGVHRLNCPPEHHVVDCPYKCFITLSEYLKHYLAIQELGWECSCPDCMYLRERQDEGQITWNSMKDKKRPVIAVSPALEVAWSVSKA